MEKSIDARGMQCPLPVIETKKLLLSMTEGMAMVVVDNFIAVQNVMKMATQKKYDSSFEKLGDDNYVVQIMVSKKLTVDMNAKNINITDTNTTDTDTTTAATKDNTEKDSPNKDSKNKDLQMKNLLSTVVKDHDIQTTHKTSEITECGTCRLESEFESTIVVLSSNHMGEGDEKLGAILMKGFIYALTQLDELPDKIILYNSGAKLSVSDSDSLADLKLLESQGVEISTCGMCLNYYELTEQLSVGSVTNMYAITETMMAATKILKP